VLSHTAINAKSRVLSHTAINAKSRVLSHTAINAKSRALSHTAINAKALRAFGEPDNQQSADSEKLNKVKCFIFFHFYLRLLINYNYFCTIFNKNNECIKNVGFKRPIILYKNYINRDKRVIEFLILKT